MTQSTDTKERTSNLFWFVLGIVATLVGGRIWPPLGLIISVTALGLVVKSGQLRSWLGLGCAVLVAAMFLLTGAYVLGLSSSTHIITTEAERVQQAFQRMSVDVAQKDGVSSVKLTPVAAGVESFFDGTKASVWVTGPTLSSVRSHCFYVDITKSGSASTSGASACGEPTKEVSLNRIGSVVVGNVGTWATSIVTVRVAVNGISADRPVTSGYFVIPSGLSADPKAKFTVVLLRKGGWEQGIVINLLASGSATPSPLVLEHTVGITSK